jgi:mono/diheme cytochrome c family protein
MVCHSRAANFVLGLSELQMNREHDYGGVRAEQLEVLESLGLFRVDWAREAGEGLRREAKSLGKSGKEAEKYVRERSPGRGAPPPRPSHLLARPASGYRRLADPADPRGEVDQRARSYLHANCSHCHVEAGGGNAQMELEATTATEGMRVIDVPPFHPIDGAADARIVAPGAPERSTLLARIARRGAGQMPPLATSQVDPEAAALLREWIERMPPAGKR